MPTPSGECPKPRFTRFTYMESKNSSSSVKSCYNLLLQVAEEATNPERLWKNKTPLKEEMCSTWIGAQSLFTLKKKSWRGYISLL